jgi:hypothetical protein
MQGGPVLYEHTQLEAPDMNHQKSLLWLSWAFIAIGAYELARSQFSAQECYEWDAFTAHLGAAFLPLGALGIGFLAYLKR